MEDEEAVDSVAEEAVVDSVGEEEAADLEDVVEAVALEAAEVVVVDDSKMYSFRPFDTQAKIKNMLQINLYFTITRAVSLLMS